MQPAEYHNLAAVERSHWWHTGMAAIAADWLRRLPGDPVRARVLDAGCGTGGALRWLSEFGSAWGAERHPLAIDLAVQSMGRKMVRADVAALPFRSGGFSILTAFDVLYHQDIVDDVAVLREFARVLKPGGWLLVRVPAYDWLRGAHDEAVQTRQRYTRGEVRHKLLCAGLKPLRVTYINTLFFIPALLWRTGQRLVGRRPVSDVRPSPPWVNRLLTVVLRLECVWLRSANLPVGLSVLALAQKGGR